MARFNFSLRDLAAGSGAQAVVSRRTLAALGPAGPDDAPHGPGWFDSSWELVRGLEVREGLPGEARLNEWLEACLRAEPAPRAGSAAERHEQPGARLVPAAPHGALSHAVQLGDLGFAVTAEVAHLDQFSEFGIDGLELL